MTELKLAQIVLVRAPEQVLVGLNGSRNHGISPPVECANPE